MSKLIRPRVEVAFQPWIDKVRMSLASGATTHPFQEADLEELRAILGPRHLHERCPGQPFLLDLVSHLASLSGDPDWEFPLTLKEGVPLGVSDPTLTSPGVWPTKEELKGEAWLGEDPPPPVAHDNYPTAERFAEEIESTFYEERALDMVDGPFTRSEAAERCRCKPDELCPGPLAGIDESDKIRTIYDGSKGGANAHIQAHTAEKTTAPMVGDCLHAIHWLRTAADHPHLLWATLPNTEERLRDVHQPVQGQSPGAEGPERDPRSTSLPPRAKGPDRGRGIMDTSGGMDVYLGSTPSGKGPPGHGMPWGEQGGTPELAAADNGGKPSSSSRQMSPRPTGVLKCSLKTGNTRWPASKTGGGSTEWARTAWPRHSCTGGGRHPWCSGSCTTSSPT